MDVVLYWDASLSQKDKDIDKEFQFLDAYFTTYPNCNVDLVIFNTRILNNANFKIKSSDWGSLKELLNKVEYHGGSDFGLITTEVSKDMLLLFTDGKENFKRFQASLYSPRIITVSSKLDIDKKFLHETAFYNRGYYVDLLEADTNSAIKAIHTKITMPRLEFIEDKNVKPSENYVQGIVTDEYGNAIPNVSITVHKKGRTTLTDQQGEYKILADLGDLLAYSMLGRKKIVVQVERENTINVEMPPVVNELDPAIVSSKKEIDSEMSTIGQLNVSKRSLGYAVQTIDADAIQGETKMNLGESIAGKFAGVKMGGNAGKLDAGQMIIRGMNSIKLGNHPFFIVDGIPLPPSDKWEKTNYDFLDTNNLEEITILKGLAATNQYGSIGRNGVVLITTKLSKNTLFPKKEEDGDKTPEIAHKIFEGPLAIHKEDSSGFVPILQKTSNPDLAYQKYFELLPHNKNNISFYVECADYFFSLSNTEIGLEILSNLAELFPTDTSVLKILAFYLEKHGLYNQAGDVYEKIIALLPSFSQTYLDQATNLFYEKEYQKSVNLFNDITKNRIEAAVSFDGIKSQIANEFKNILRNRNQHWNVKGVASNYFTAPRYPLRVVTEWSHPQTEFSLQFINAKKQYFTRTHNRIDNKQQLNQELLEGFTSDEFVSTDIESGVWYLNVITPKGYQPNLQYPKYLKIKVFTKFGSLDQQLETYLINLDRVVTERLITSFVIP